MSDNEATQSFQLPTTLVIGNIEEIFVQFKQIDFKNSVPFSLDASQVKSITTPGVQLILSLERTLKEHNSNFLLVNASENFKESFRTLGLGNKLESWSAGNDSKF